MSDYVIRPIRESDFEAYKDLAFSTRGMTSLPRDEKLLKKKVKNSVRAFAEDISSPGGEIYLFVLEDRKTKQIVGVSGIISKVGGFEPFYSYKIHAETLYSKELKVKREIKVLHLTVNHNGPTEICSLLLNEKLRGSGLGRLLSLARFLFIGEFRDRFDKEVISEMRGVMGPNGSPPFWDCVGRHFFDTDFFAADHLCSLGRKDFIAELMPKHPIYHDLLPQSAKDVIGKVHQDATPARKLLESEGLRFVDEVDIFDAGPTMKASVDDLRVIKQGKKMKVLKISKTLSGSNDYLISNCHLDFRCTLAPVEIQNPNEGVILSAATAQALEVSEGQEVRVAGMR